MYGFCIYPEVLCFVVVVFFLRMLLHLQCWSSTFSKKVSLGLLLSISNEEPLL